MCIGRVHCELLGWLPGSLPVNSSLSFDVSGVEMFFWHFEDPGGDIPDFMVKKFAGGMMVCFAYATFVSNHRWCVTCRMTVLTRC